MTRLGHLRWVRQLARALALEAALSTGGTAPQAADEPALAAPSVAAPAVAARVGEQPITVAEVERLVNVATGSRASDPAALAQVQAQALTALVNQRLIESACRRLGIEPAEGEVAARRDQLRQQLVAQGRSLEQALAERGLDEAHLLVELAGQLLLEKYAQTQLTPEALEQFFAAHRAEFDGTQWRVAQVLFRPAGRFSREALARTVVEAQRVRAEIDAGRLSFDEAARRYSAGPSRRQGGDLGWVDRQSPWHAGLFEAIAPLVAGELSQPVVSPSGVHLFECREIRPGTKTLADVRAEVSQRCTQEALQELVKSESERVGVEFTGAVPYFRAGTRELVLPQGATSSEPAAAPRDAP